MRNSKLRYLAQAAVIAALYIALTFVSAVLGLASGAVQIRLSEALAVLPCFTPAALPGLFVGCLMANLLTGCALWDVVFGSLATLVGAALCRLLRKRPALSPIPNIVANTLVIPPVLMFVYGTAGTYWYFALTVGLGELISCGLLGTLLRRALVPHERRLFGDDGRTL